TICRFLPDGDPEEVYSLSDEELTRGYIYGIRTEGNKLYYRLYTSYDAATFAGEGFIVLFPAPDPVVITSQPADQEVLRDEVAVFTVEAEGSIASYQWQYKIKGRTKWYNCTTSMIGYDTPELHVAATLSRDGFQYRCVITGENGEEIISDAAHLTVIANAIEITSQPQDQEVTAGETAHFIVAAEGNGLTYQWQYKIAGRTKWYNSSASTTGYNSAELQVAATLTRNGYEYRCVITDAANHEIISDAATLIVVEAPPFGIISQPQSVSITEGEIAHFTVEAEGENLTYKWQYKIAGSTKWRNSSSITVGYNTAELQVSATLARNGYRYRCIVSNGSNSETSSAATLTVTEQSPKITADPQSRTVAAGETAYFTVAAKGEGLIYQWQYKIAGQASWRNCTSSTTGYQSEELEVVGTAKRNGFEYRCKVTDANGETVTSKAATLTVE
ncbi:MAG: immunoglobulin domain-containing protein, partial [Lachnospiraceae bacterium]|nr:immunoglobulin domain-containing protein [Lachnospiraceae bacterium]